MRTPVFLMGIVLLVMSGGATLAQKDPTASILAEEKARIGANQQAQKQVDQVHKKTGDLVSDYQNKLKIVDGLKVYNALLAKQLENQQADIETLQTTIANATVIERQIVPLLIRMLDGLQEFIALDVPFVLEEREQRVDKLRGLMERADLTVAEKCRRVFEAFQIENDYGRTLEAYKGKLNLDEKSFDVDYLRIGRVAFLYRSAGNDRFGYWDVDSRQWVEISESQFRRNINKGLKIARQEMAPELITVPVSPVQEVL